MKDLTNDINKIKKYCSDYLENTISINNTLTHQTKAAEVENIICLEKEIQVINWLENKLLCMKKNIIDRVEKSNQIKNISKIQIDKSEFICSFIFFDSFSPLICLIAASSLTPNIPGMLSDLSPTKAKKSMT